MISKNLFLQGIFPFEGIGMEKPVPLHGELAHFVPDGVVNQTLFAILLISTAPMLWRWFGHRLSSM